MRWLPIHIGLLACWSTTSVSAQPAAAIMLSMESNDPALVAEELRSSLAEIVGLPVVGLAGTEAPVALIVVSAPRGENASVIATAHGTPRMHTIERTQQDDWLQTGLVAIVEDIKTELTELRVETIRRRDRYALMSWAGGLRPRREPRLLRPWPWEAGRPAPLRPSRIGGEVGSALSTPQPSR